MQTVTPTVNALVEVRGQRWVVSEVEPGPADASTVLTLQSPHVAMGDPAAHVPQNSCQVGADPDSGAGILNDAAVAN
jgi:hypothetical protein